jgi:hypothetical protein
VRRAFLTVGAILLLGLGAAGPAGAQTVVPSPPGGRFSERTLTIYTLPAVEGLRFRFEGKIYRSNALGQVYLPHAAVIARRPPRAFDGRIRENARVRFARYFGDQHSGRLTATYDVDFRVSFDFTDLVGHPIPPAAIAEMTYKSSIGYRATVSAGGERWLQGARVVSESAQRMALKTILYRLERVIVHGTNVVNRAEQSFQPRFRRHVSVQLLYYTASLSARDAFFGFKAGSKVKLTYPDGTVERYPLGSDGNVTIPALPRGEYDVTVEGGGIPISRPLSLSKNSTLQIEVLSYLDIGIVAGLLLLFVVGLPLIRRPHLMRRPFRRLIRRSAPEAPATAETDGEGGEPAHGPTNGVVPRADANRALSASKDKPAAPGRTDQPR